jgi:hypothetical protein
MEPHPLNSGGIGEGELGLHISKNGKPYIGTKQSLNNKKAGG